MQEYDAKLVIYSVSDNSVTLTEKLVSKFKDKYLEVLLSSNLAEIELSNVDYLIVNLLDDHQNLNEIKSMVNGLVCKIVVLFPLYIKSEEKYVTDIAISELLEINKNIGVILTPELLGEGVKYNEHYVSHDIIMQSLVSERIKISNSGTLINSITLNKLADSIVKETFSFGIAGQVLALVGPRRGVKSFIVNYLGATEDNIIMINSVQMNVEVNRTVSSKVEFSLRLAVKATRNTFLEKLNKVESSLHSVKKKYTFFCQCNERINHC